jgi:hypothetical protein
MARRSRRKPGRCTPEPNRSASGLEIGSVALANAALTWLRCSDVCVALSSRSSGRANRSPGDQSPAAIRRLSRFQCGSSRKGVLSRAPMKLHELDSSAVAKARLARAGAGLGALVAGLMASATLLHCSSVDDRAPNVLREPEQPGAGGAPSGSGAGGSASASAPSASAGAAASAPLDPPGSALPSSAPPGSAPPGSAPPGSAPPGGAGSGAAGAEPSATPEFCTVGVSSVGACRIPPG